MKPENRAFIEKHRNHWITLRDAFYLRSLDGGTRSEMQRILGEEFAPGYNTDLWCGPCVTDMVKLLYTNYERWLAANPDPVDPPQPETMPAEVVPEEPGQPIKVPATFPKHKRGRR